MTTPRRTRIIASAVLALAAGTFALRRHGERERHAAPPSAAPEPSVDEPTHAPPEVVTGREPPVNAPVTAASAPLAPPAPMAEPALMTLLRSANGNDAALAVELARDGNRRFPDSPDAPERSSILVHALAELGQASAARGEAEHMVNHYPDSRWIREVEAFTGAHRHRNVVLDDAGQLHFVDPPPS